MKHWWHFGTKSYFNNLVRSRIPHGAAILDAGCGVGDMMMLLKDDYQITGTDCAPEALQACKEKGLAEKVLMGDINHLPFPENSFEGVLSLDVLYHQWVKDDLHALKEMYRILKPKGELYIQLPAYEWLKSAHDEWACTSRRYTRRQLEKLLDDAGFTSSKVYYRMLFLFPFALISRKVLKRKESDMKQMNYLVNAILMLVMKIENALLRHFNFPFGLSVVGVAQK